MTPRRSRGPSRLRRSLRAISAVTTTALVVGLGAAVGISAANAATNAAITIIPEPTATTPHSQFDPFAYTFDWACTSGGGLQTCDDLRIEIPVKLEPRAGQVEFLHKWNYRVDFPSGSPLSYWSTGTGNERRVIITSSAPIPAGTQETFVLTVTPDSHVGDGTRFTVGDAVLTTSNGDPARSGSYTSETTTNPLNDPRIIASGGLRTETNTQVVNYQVRPNLATIVNSAGGSFHHMAGTPAANATSPNVTAILSTLSITLPLPAGATVARLGDGVTYDAATHTLTFSGGSSYFLATSFVFALEYPESMDGQSVTLTGDRSFTASNGVPQSDPFTVTHPLNYKLPTEGEVSKCGTGTFAGADRNRYPGMCGNFVALAAEWAPTGTSTTGGSSQLTGNYAVVVTNVRAGDTVHLRDFMPCLDNQTGTSPFETFQSQEICQNPSMQFHSFSANITPIGQGSGQQIRDADVTVFNNLGTESASRTALNADFGTPTQGVWHGVDMTIRNIPYDGSLKININVNLLPEANRDMLLQNIAYVERFRAGATEPSLAGNSPIGTIRVEDQVAGRVMVTTASGTNGLTYNVDFTTFGLNPTSGYPVYTVQLPPGFVNTISPLQIAVDGRSYRPATEVFDVEEIPEDTAAGTGIKYILKQRPGTAADPVLGQGWPRITVRTYLEPTWGNPYARQRMVNTLSVNGPGNAVDTCVAGTFNTNDPNDQDRDGVVGTDPSCVRESDMVLLTPSAAASGVATKAVRDMASGNWVSGNSRANILSDEMEYRISWTNAGQPTLSDVVLYDVFPYDGDTGTTSLTQGTSRGSTYQPVFAGLTSAIPAGMTVEYSASTNPCRPEVQATNPGCVNDWTADVADLGGEANVKALRLVLAGNQVTGTSYALSFKMNVPPTASNLNIAWNTVAHRAILNGTPMTPAETARIGAFLPSNVEVKKHFENGDSQLDFEVGDTIPYSIEIWNEFGTGMENVVIDDDLTEMLRYATFNNDAVASSGAVSFDPDTSTLHWEGGLAPNERVTLSYSLTATGPTPEDGAANKVVGTTNGEVTNCATGEEYPCSATSLILAPADISIDKLDEDGYEGGTVLDGTWVDWQYVVTNTGGLPLSQVRVTDNHRSVSVACPRSNLGIGESMTCTGQGNVFGDSSYTNRGTVTGLGSDGTSVSDYDDWTVQLESLDPVLTLDKVARGIEEGAVLEPNQQVTWDYIVTNTGTDSFEFISVLDDRGVRVVCPNPVNLEPGDSVTCSGTGTVGYSESYQNTGTVTGTGYFSGRTTTAEDTWSSTVRQLPTGLAIDKYAPEVTEDSTIRPNTEVDWEYLVTNTGEQPVGKLRVTDDQGVQVSCPFEELEPGQSMICTGTGNVGEGDSYSNIGTVTGTSTLTPNELEASDEWSVLLEEAVPSLAIVKGSDDAVDGSIVEAGAEVTWNYTVTNTGTERIVNLAVTDDQGVDVSCPVTELDVNESVTCTGTGMIGNVGTYTNVGTATGEGEETGDPTESSDDWTVDVEPPTTSTTIEKSSPDHEYGSVVAPETVVNWEYEVVNTGSETLINVVVTDDQGVEVACPAETLAPYESMICTGTGSIGSGDGYTNIGTVTAVGEISDTETSAEDSWTVFITPPEPGDDPEEPDTTTEWPNKPVGGTPNKPGTNLATTGAAGLGFVGVAGVSILMLGLVLMLAQRRKVTS